MSISLFRTREGVQIEGQRDVPTDNTSRVNIIKARVDPTVTGVDAPMGSMLLRTDNGSAYIKTAATGTPTGWTLIMTSSGASAEDTAQNTFMGKSSTGSIMPTYSSTNVVTSTTDSLQAAIGKLDAKIGANPGPVARTNNPIVAISALQVNIDNLDAAIGVDTTPVTRTNNPIVVNTTVNSNIGKLDAAIGLTVTSTNYAQASNTVNANISALDTQTKTNSDAITVLQSGIAWRAKVKAITASTSLRSASELTALSTLLPFSDDQTPVMVIGDFAIGDYIISENGATSKLWKLNSSMQITAVGFNALAVGDTFFVQNDILDTIAARETSAIYTFTGTAMAKMSDVDWQFATGIDLSGAYAAAAGTVAAGNTVEAAIQKIDGNANALISLSGQAGGSTNLGAATGNIVSANSTVKAAINSLDSSASNLITLTGVAKDAVNLGTFPGGTVVADSVTIKTALASLDTDVTNIRTTTGTAVGDTSMGTYTGTLLTASQTTKQNIQQIATEMEAREIRFSSVSAAGTGASTTVDTFTLATNTTLGVEWKFVVMNGATGRYMGTILALSNSAGTVVDNNEFGTLEVGTAPNISMSVTISTGTISLVITNSEASSVTVSGTRRIIRQ